MGKNTSKMKTFIVAFMGSMWNEMWFANITVIMFFSIPPSASGVQFRCITVVTLCITQSEAETLVAQHTFCHSYRVNKGSSFCPDNTVYVRSGDDRNVSLID